MGDFSKYFGGFNRSNHLFNLFQDALSFQLLLRCLAMQP